MLFKNSVRTSKRTPHFTITKINWLTLFKFKPTYYSSCVWVCYWVQALLSPKSSQSALSKLHITTRIPLRKETFSLTATIAQIIPENHKLSLKIPEVNEQRGQRWQKAYRRRQRDSEVRTCWEEDVRRERNAHLQVRGSDISLRLWNVVGCESE
jgi:hypothetical protein